MFKAGKFKTCGRLFSRPFCMNAGGRSATIMPSITLQKTPNIFYSQIPKMLILSEIQVINRSLSTLLPQLSEKITPEIEQMLEISLEERSLEEEESTNGVRLAKCSHTSLEMFIAPVISKYVDLKQQDEWKSLHLCDLSLKFKVSLGLCEI